MCVQKRIPHITALGFLTFLLFPIGCMLFLQGAQWYLKHTADRRMGKETVITIAVPAASVQWEKAEKEIVLNGKMFDIKSYSIKDGVFTATGYYDEKETSVRKLLLALPHDKNKNFLLHFFLLLQCFTVVLVWLDEWLFFRRGEKLHTLFFFYLPSPFPSRDEHPPQPKITLA